LEHRFHTGVFPLRGFAVYSAPPPSVADDGDEPENEEVEAIINGVPMRRKKLRVKLVHMWRIYRAL